MQQYRNLSGRSNVVAYENGPDYIKVQFATGYWKIYTYTNMSAGASTVQRMHQMANAGYGLNSFISTNKPPYTSKC